MKKTRLLQNLLIQNQTTLSPQDFRSLSDEVDQLIEQAMVTLSKIPSGILRAENVHTYLDQKNSTFLEQLKLYFQKHSVDTQ